ncbi:unnamed protein product [Arabis nemorensis]|uniref:NYN domain-containing protein n=1 Tax=Arabis nemorensis TaxID=586526 RepID=A0A565BHF5_9BRAS|nr:unnamed protein product [Arabis nemorensis]
MGVTPIVMKREEIREKFAYTETAVYWDMKDFPVTDIVLFNQNIRLALADAGYLGKVSIRAYGDEKPDDEEYYKNAEITFVSRGSKRARMHMMLVDMHFWVADNRDCSLKNVMVIAKNIMPADDDDDMLFQANLGLMNARCYNILLAVPDDYQLRNMPFRCNYTVWHWSDLLAGGKPLDDSLVFRWYDQEPPRNIEAEPCTLCGK